MVWESLEEWLGMCMRAILGVFWKVNVEISLCAEEWTVTSPDQTRPGQKP